MHESKILTQRVEPSNPHYVIARSSAYSLNDETDLVQLG